MNVRIQVFTFVHVTQHLQGATCRTWLEVFCCRRFCFSCPPCSSLLSSSFLVASRMEQQQPPRAQSKRVRWQSKRVSNMTQEYTEQQCAKKRGSDSTWNVDHRRARQGQFVALSSSLLAKVLGRTRTWSHERCLRTNLQARREDGGIPVCTDNWSCNESAVCGGQNSS